MCWRTVWQNADGCRQPAAKCVVSARKLAHTRVETLQCTGNNQPETIIDSPTSWSGPVPLSTTVSVRNSNICCSQMGFLPTTQKCLAYKYCSCVLQHLSEIGQKPIFQCKDRNTNLKSGQNHVKNARIWITIIEALQNIKVLPVLKKHTVYNPIVCQKSVHYWPHFVISFCQ